jgi:DNA-directed RNA polymerase subunit RPC12/RpoP
MPKPNPKPHLYTCAKCGKNTGQTYDYQEKGKWKHICHECWWKGVVGDY